MTTNKKTLMPGYYLIIIKNFKIDYFFSTCNSEARLIGKSSAHLDHKSPPLHRCYHTQRIGPMTTSSAMNTDFGPDSLHRPSQTPNSGHGSAPLHSSTSSFSKNNIHNRSYSQIKGIFFSF